MTLRTIQNSRLVDGEKLDNLPADVQAELDLKADKSNVLELDNTDAFTPDADYEPATKKYVDDNAGAGDMSKAVYDPTNVNGDAFDQDNMVDGATNKNYTATEQTKLAGIDPGAEVNAVDSVHGRTGVVVSVDGDYTASEVTNVPAGDIAAITVQAAIDELDTEKVSTAVGITSDAVIADGHITEGDGGARKIKDTEINISQLKNLTSTAYISGGAITINGGDPAKFDVAAGTGVVVDNYTDTTAPTYTEVSFGPFTAQVVTDLANADSTFLTIDSSGTLIQRLTIQNSEQRKDEFMIGSVNHPSRVDILSTDDFTNNIPADISLSMADFSEIVKPIKRRRTGLYTANGANVKIDRSATKFWFHGLNYKKDAKNPNIIEQIASTEEPFLLAWRDGSGDFNASAAFVTDLDTTVYDDGAGGALAPAGVIQDWQYQIFRIFFSPNAGFTFIQYGQALYSNKDNARAAIMEEDFDIDDILNETTYMGAIIAPGNSTDLSADADFIPSDEFGQPNVGVPKLSDGVTNLFNFANGSVIDASAQTVTESGGTVSLNIEREGGGDLTVQFGGTNYTFASTPAASIALTAGSDTAPTQNFVYFELSGSTVVLAKNTSGFPDTEHAPLAEVYVQSPTGVSTDGPYDHHAWVNEIGNGQGHLDDINFWIRNQPATWLRGAEPTTTIVVNGGAIDNVYIASTSGRSLQLHEHEIRALDMQTGDPAWVINDSTSAYDRVVDLSAIDTDSTGATLRANNTYYSLGVIINVAQNASDVKYFINSPSGSYANSTDAIADPLGYTNLSIPVEFTGTAFVAARVVLRYQTLASGTFTEILTEVRPSVGGAGGGSVAGTEFSDNLFRVFNVADNTKELAFDISGVTTSTLRTLTVPDASGTMILTDQTDPQTIGLTGSRLTKLWATDVEVTNAIAGSVTGNAATVSTITGLAPDTATTQATQPNITTCTALTTVGTLVAGNVDAAISVLPDGTTATTQSASDNSTKVATTAYVDASGGGGVSKFDASVGSGGDYADIQAAITGVGGTNIVLLMVSDVTEDSDITMPAGVVYIETSKYNLNMGDYELTMTSNDSRLIIKGNGIDTGSKITYAHTGSARLVNENGFSTSELEIEGLNIDNNSTVSNTYTSTCIERIMNVKFTLPDENDAGVGGVDDKSTYSNLYFVGGGSTCAGVNSNGQGKSDNINYSGTYSTSVNMTKFGTESSANNIHFDVTNGVIVEAGNCRISNITSTNPITLLITSNFTHVNNFDLSGSIIDLDSRDGCTFSNGYSQGALILSNVGSTENFFNNMYIGGATSVTGDRNKFTNCTFITTVTVNSGGDDNSFMSCDMATLTINSGANRTIVIGNSINTAFNDNGTDTEAFGNPIY